MRKILFGLPIFFVALALGGFAIWEGKTQISAYILARHLQVPIHIQDLEITKTQIELQNLWVGNPFRSRTHTAFSAEQIDMDMEVPKILNNPLLIEEIEIANIFVGIEYYEDGSTNWDKILGSASPKKDQGREYLIRTLILKNLTVEVVQANGQKKRYPTIAKMEFHNISNETGFPVGEIEKAIFNLMMKNILDKFNLFKQPLNLPGNNPLRFIPSFSFTPKRFQNVDPSHTLSE